MTDQQRADVVIRRLLTYLDGIDSSLTWDELCETEVEPDLTYGWQIMGFNGDLEDSLLEEWAYEVCDDVCDAEAVLDQPTYNEVVRLVREAVSGIDPRTLRVVELATG